MEKRRELGELPPISEFVNRDFGTDVCITDKTVEEMRRYGQTHCVGDVRVAHGCVITDDEMERRRKEDYLP